MRRVSSGRRRSPRAARRRRAPPQRQLELGAHRRQRRAQLVARVAHQPALACEAGLEPVEHLVQRAAEGTDLVARLGYRQSLGRVALADRRRPAAHPLHGPQRRPGDLVAGEGRDQQRERQRDQQQPVRERRGWRPARSSESPMTTTARSPSSSRAGTARSAHLGSIERSALDRQRLPDGLLQLGGLEQPASGARAGRREQLAVGGVDLRVAFPACQDRVGSRAGLDQGRDVLCLRTLGVGDRAVEIAFELTQRGRRRPRGAAER